MTFPDGATTKGIDGIAFYQGKLIAIHNGVNPIRIIKYELDQKKNIITKSSIMDQARLEFSEPTSGYIYQNHFYFIANSPWSAYNKDMSFDLKKLKKPLLYKYKLGK